MYRRLAGFLLALAPFASQAQTSGHWIEMQSPHFTVLTNDSDAQARHVAGQLERMRSVFHTLIPATSDDVGSRITVVALKDRKSFQALEPEAYLAKGQANLSGLFVRAPERNYILLRTDAEGPNPYSVVYHEYTHYITRQSMSSMPLWLNEGLAEFYQNTVIEDKSVILGGIDDDEIRFLRGTRMIPVATLVQIDHSSPYYHEEQKASVFYAESWALTHYLMVLDYQNKSHRLHDYFTQLSQQVDPLTAAQNAFGDLKLLDRQLEAYISRLALSQFRMSSGASINEAKFTVRPIPTPEADSTRAEVLVAVGRLKDARTLLDNILQADPKSASAHEAMASLNYRERDLPGARDEYRQAIRLGSQSYVAQYQFATMTLQLGDRNQDAEVQSSLRTAIQLNPTFAPSYDTLAMFFGTRHRDLDEAHLLNVKAIGLDPSNIAYRLNAASILLENNQLASAASVLNVALKVASMPAEKQRVQARIDELKDYRTSPAPTTWTAEDHSADNTKITPSEDGKTVTLESGQPETPTYPTAPSTGPRHTIRGKIHDVRCSYPAMLTLTVNPDGKNPGGKPLALYTANYIKLPFTTDKPSHHFDPCKSIEDVDATLVYAEITDATMAGQLVSIELNQ